MSGLFGVIDPSGPAEGLAATILSAAPHRWRRGQWRYREGPALMICSRTMENGLDLAGPPPAGDGSPVVAACGRLDKVPGCDFSSPAIDLSDPWVHRGPELLAHTLGDFALAVWEPQKERLYLARDPMGQRALYVHDEGHRITFGNDMSLLGAAGIHLEPSDPAIRMFLCGEFLEPSGSMFDGVEQVEPGTVLEWRPGSRRIHRVWSWEPSPVRYSKDDEYVDHFLELFRAAVKCRCAGQRTAVLLSGGLDSPTIAVAAAATGIDVRTYTFETMRHPTANEAHLAATVAEALRVPIHTLDWDASPPLDGFPALGPDVDDPYVGAYQASLDAAYQAAAAEGATVVLAGDRGDLVFGDSVYGHLELLLSGRLPTLFGDLGHERERQDSSWVDMVNRYLLRPFGSSLLRRESGTRPRRSPRAPAWLRGECPVADTETRLMRLDAPGPRAYGRRQRLQTVFTRMHTMGALWTERHAMRHGLASADPWSDPRVVQFALQVPQSVLNRTRERKRLVRAALRRFLPEAVVSGLGKVDPGPVFEEALVSNAGAIQGMLEAPLLEQGGWVDAEELRAHYQGVLSGGEVDSGFWWTLSVEWWLRRHWA